MHNNYIVLIIVYICYSNIYKPWNRGAGTLKENTRDAVKQHLMYQKTDHQRTQLNSNDVEIGIESGAYGGWIQKEHVRPFIGRPRGILEACLFLQEEHLGIQAWVMKSALFFQLYFECMVWRSPLNFHEFCENFFYVFCNYIYTEAMVNSS